MKIRLNRLILSPLLFCPIAAMAANGLSSVGTPAAVATFECIGISVNFSGDDNKNAACDVEYAVKGQSNWKTGHTMFVDYRTNAFWNINSRQFRGSIVHLDPNTTYLIRLTYTDPDGGSGGKQLECTTWSETFPEGTVTTVSDQSTTLNITASGTASGYRVYQPAQGQTATIDSKHSKANCITINANYIIIRGLKLANSYNHAITIADNCHDIVIEDCEITGWGPEGISRASTAIKAFRETERIVVEHMTPAEALAMIRDGRIVDAKTIITLLRWATERKEST